MPKEELKPVKCKCGMTARLSPHSTYGEYVECKKGNGTEDGCWIGPVRLTDREAIKAWNKAMSCSG